MNNVYVKINASEKIFSAACLAAPGRISGSGFDFILLMVTFWHALK